MKTIDFSRIPQTDAEGQQARIGFRTTAAFGPQALTPIGGIPAVVQYETTAGELAQGARAACGACRHWDHRAWIDFLVMSEAPGGKSEDRQTVNSMRGRLMMAGYGPEDAQGDVDIEAALRSFGFCRVLSDIVKSWVGENPIHWPVVVARDANCPSYVAAEGHRMEIVTPAMPLGLYAPKDLEAQRVGAQRYDAVLHDAQGKL